MNLKSNTRAALEEILCINVIKNCPLKLPVISVMQTTIIDCTKTQRGRKGRTKKLTSANFYFVHK